MKKTLFIVSLFFLSFSANGAITQTHSGLIRAFNFDADTNAPAGSDFLATGTGVGAVIADATAPSSPNVLQGTSSSDGYPHTHGGGLIFTDETSKRQSLVWSGRIKPATSGTNRRTGVMVRWSSPTNTRGYLMFAIENTKATIVKINYPTGDSEVASLSMSPTAQWYWVKVVADGWTYKFYIAEEATPGTIAKTLTYTEPVRASALYQIGSVAQGVWCNGNDGRFDDVALMESNRFTVVNVPTGGYVTVGSTNYPAYQGIAHVDLGTGVQLPIASFTINSSTGATLATFSGAAYGGDVYDSGLPYDGNMRGDEYSRERAYKSATFVTRAPSTILGTDYFSTGHAYMKSSYVSHLWAMDYPTEFTTIEGAGWPTNGIFGSYLIYRMGKIKSDTGMQATAQSLLSHCLYDGQGGTGAWPDRFFEMSAGLPTGKMRMIRNDTDDEYWLNYRKNNNWQETYARINAALGLIYWYKTLPAGTLKTDCGVYAKAIVDWNIANVERGANGNMARFIDDNGAAYARTDSLSGLEGIDPKAQYRTPTLALHVLSMKQLQELGLATYTSTITADVNTFKAIYQDCLVTLDSDFDSFGIESYSWAAIAAYELGTYLSDSALTAIGDALVGAIPKFALNDSFNQSGGFFPSNGLHRECDELTWNNSSYGWEQASAALAYLMRYKKTGGAQWRDVGLGIISKYISMQYGPYGMVTEGWYWEANGAGSGVGAAVGMNADLYAGGVRFTEPLLNNLMHILPYVYAKDNGISLSEEVGGYSFGSAQ